MTVADYFKERLGWKPVQRPFFTTANRQCGACGSIKSGSNFDVPVTPGRPDLQHLPRVRYRMTKVRFVPNRKTITRLDPKRDAGPHVRALRSPERQRNAMGCTRRFAHFALPCA